MQMLTYIHTHMGACVYTYYVMLFDVYNIFNFVTILSILLQLSPPTFSLPIPNFSTEKQKGMACYLYTAVCTSVGERDRDVEQSDLELIIY